VRISESPVKVSNRARIGQKPGPYYYWIARGIDERPVRADRIRKPVSAENTFPADLFAFDAARDALQPIVEKVWRHCESAGERGRTVTLKVKLAGFQLITRRRTGVAPFATHAQLERQSLELLEHLFPVPKGIRLLGVSLSSLDEEQTNKDASVEPGGRQGRMQCIGYQWREALEAPMLFGVQN
jgi:DNA polymerase-4